MPKKTRQQKLRNEIRTNTSVQRGETVVLQTDLLSINPYFKKDLIKSIFFAVFISVFEIALYFIYYLRVFERR